MKPQFEDPFAIYTARTNDELHAIQRSLENEGIAAFAVEDLSVVGQWAFGVLPDVHKPQIWIERADSERAKEVILDYERRRDARDAVRAAATPEVIDAVCEDCGRASSFAGSLEGTVQDCPGCGSPVDVGVVDEWEGEWMEANTDDQSVDE